MGPVILNTGNRDELLDALNGWLKNSHSNTAQGANSNYLVGFLNPHVFNLSMEHEAVLTFLNQAHATCLDGVGTKLAIFMASGKLFPRVVAEHLFEEFLKTLNHPVNAVLIGAEPEVVTKAARSMHGINENLNIVATLDGYSGIDQFSEFIQEHRKIPLVLLGAGSPVSESYALLAQSECQGSVIFHIGGGTLNTYAGTKRRGPKWISAIGFEWLHRILFEPHTRHRYISGGWLFAANLFATRQSSTGINGDPS